MAGVRLENVEKRYGDFVAVRGVTLDIRKGEFVTLLGASGSGKTTCLRMVAGFVVPTAGRVLIDDVDVTHVPPHRRQTGMVFQQYALFPHLTVAQNVSFGLQVRRLPREVVRQRTLAALELVHLEGHAGRYPSQLSGGQRQRVALARAVVIEPRVLLLDEPLAALDLKLREELQGEIKRVQETLGITALFVTHDQNEALGLSDRVVVMRDGAILQVDSPTSLYRRPRSRYVANFVGRTNFLAAVVRDRNEEGTVFRLALDDGSGQAIEVRGRQAGDHPPGSRCLVAFRPEDARLASAGPNVLRARLDKATYVGPGWTLSCARTADEAVTIALPATAEIPPIGETIPIAWAPELAILLPLEGDS